MRYRALQVSLRKFHGSFRFAWVDHHGLPAAASGSTMQVLASSDLSVMSISASAAGKKVVNADQVRELPAGQEEAGRVAERIEIAASAAAIEGSNCPKFGQLFDAPLAGHVTTGHRCELTSGASE
jgi:hypothetical protein